MSNTEQAGAGNPDGLVVQPIATGKLCFYGGTTTVVRQTAAGAVTGASDATALSAAITAISLTLHNLNLTN
jgi:hypothetical protein